MKKNQQLALDFDQDSQTEETTVIEVKPTTTKFQALGGMFQKYKLEDKGGYITKEFQDFGYRMALELEDVKRTSLYMRLAKNTKRGMLEKALSFVADAPNVKSKSRLFMWKLKQLKENKDTPSGENLSKPDKS